MGDRPAWQQSAKGGGGGDFLDSCEAEGKSESQWQTF